MARFVNIDKLSAGSGQMPAFALPSDDLYTPTVEDLLRRLAAIHAPARDTQPKFRFGPWTVVATFLVSICVPGCAAAAIFLIKSQIVDPAETQQALARADRLDRTEPFVRAVNPAKESQARFRETLDVGDLLEPITFRGSIESASLTVLSPTPAPAPAPSHKQKSKRSAAQAPPPKLPVEIPQPDARPPSLLERLFGINVPAPLT
jgi:hypothetical protein